MKIYWGNIDNFKTKIYLISPNNLNCKNFRSDFLDVALLDFLIFPLRVKNFDDESSS